MARLRPTRWWEPSWSKAAESSGEAGITAPVSLTPKSVGEYEMTAGIAPRDDEVSKDNNASRRHAEIVREGDTFVLVDLGSTNGTELNGRRISREELTDSDRITIGATDLVFGRSRP